MEGSILPPLLTMGEVLQLWLHTHTSQDTALGLYCWVPHRTGTFVYVCSLWNRPLAISYHALEPPNLLSTED